MRTICPSILALAYLLIATSLSAQEVDFTRDIRPILSDKCFACHGNDEKTREADLRLDVRDQAVDLEAIVPGSLEDSNAWQRIISDDESEVMPPPHTHKSLSDIEKQKIRRWIEHGAEYEKHWSYQPVVQPKIELAETSQSPIDALVQKSLKQQNLNLAKRADRATLIRRLSLDLTGLPPTFEEVEAFLNDDSEDAYEKLVDRLLADEAFGERMAIFWLDLVRYADTIGYHTDNHMEVSAFRDYVIDSFNANKPFDEFTIEQLAGDLLPNPTTEQKIASGYNRLLQTTEEGGAQPKEYIAIYAADRVRNVSGVWLGQTMGCAQCHDHKYDPITARDFYSMSAFFADIRETAVGKQPTNLTLFTDKEKEQLAALEKQLADLKTRESTFRESKSKARAEAQQKWEQSFESSITGSDHQWFIPEVENVTATVGKLKELGDGSLLIQGNVPKTSNYEFDVVTRNKVTSIRVEALTDSSFAIKDGLSAGNGNFVLTDFKVLDGEKEIKIKSAKADHSQGDYPAKNAIDDNSETGWAVSGHFKRDGRRVIIFQLEETIDVAERGKLRIRMLHESPFAKHNIGRFRLSIATNNDSAAEYSFDGKTSPPEKTSKLIRIPKDQRTADQQRQLDEAFLDGSKEMLDIRNQLKAVEQKIASIRTAARTMLIAESMSKPRVTKIRNRGDWMDESGEVVQPAVPAFLPADFGDVERRLNRLDLAKWIVDPSNPLTARTFVNRLWNIFHGRGISNNLDDLGGQGEPPTHPELLDWLAADFQSDWDIKRAIKQMVMTDTYCQSSVPSRDVKQKDPENKWYARQGRWRVDAEFVRDTALQLSGLLNDSQVGGLSVKPYQPEGYWQHLNFPKRKWQADSGPKLYRKSLYTFWCRSFLHPSMLAFDAPTREECVANRARSNIPQQALVLLNDPIFVEAARGFGLRMMQEEGDVYQKVRWGWQQAVGRKAKDAEISLLVGLYESQRERFKESEDDSNALLKVGESPLPEGVDVAELSAWTQVARAIINAYETISRY